MTRSKSLNPRSIWDRWRNHKPLRQYHHRQRGDKENNNNMQRDGDDEQSMKAEAPSIISSDTCTTGTSKPVVVLAQSSRGGGASLQHPPSPIPNESDIQEEATPQMQLQNESVDYNYTLTPPSFVPAPLVVSANRLSKDLRRKHSKRRRGRLSDQTNLSSASSCNNSGMLEWRGGRRKRAYSEDDEPDDWEVNMALLSPDQRRRHYWQVCYGSSNVTPPPPQQSWSAQRMPPVKSW